MVAAHAERLVAKMLRGRWRTPIQTQNDVAPSRRKNRRGDRAAHRVPARIAPHKTIIHLPSTPLGSLTPAEVPLIDAGKPVQTAETALELGELSRAIGLATSRTKSVKVRTTGLTVRFFNVMIVT